MNSRFVALSLGGLLALTSMVATPVMADDWNKRTEFQFSGPVEIPGRVLLPGKYVFQLADSVSDRNIVQVFSQDSNGKESLVATILAIPAYVENTPDHPVIRFEERAAGSPEAIKRWFYPGDNNGWEFIYPQSQSLEASANTMPEMTQPAATVAMVQPTAPEVREETPATEVDAVEEPVVAAQEDTPAPPTEEADPGSIDPVLPETGGYSAAVFVTGLAMVLGGMLTRFSARRKHQA